MKSIKINESLPYDRLSTYFKTNVGVVIAFSLTGLLFDGLMSFIPKYLGTIINMAQEGAEAAEVLKNGLYFIGLVCFIQINRFFKRYFVRLFDNRMMYAMRKVSFDYIIHSPIQSLSSNSRGDILNRNLTDISDACEGVRKICTEIFDTFVLLIGYIITMFFYDWKITLIFLGFIIVSITVAQAISQPVYKAVKSYKQYLSHTKDETLYSLKNETYYRGLGVSSYYEQKYETSQSKLEKMAIRSLMFQSALEPVYKIIVLIALFFVLFLGGQNVMGSNPVWLIGDFSAYLTTYLLVADKASHIGKLANAYQSLKVSWERCKIYLKHPQKEESEKKLDDSGLVVDNLSFGFSDEGRINNISLTAKPGEVIGVCGRVHSGKSTFLQAINGLYDIKGSVKLGGLETRVIRKAEIPNAIGLCSSDPEIFEDSIQANISMGQSEPIDKALYISDFSREVEEKNQGETLTRSVANLSGGQQKRLMIARAVYGNPKLLLLDNPFESIDEPMSLEIVRRIKEKMPNSIVFMVSNQTNILKESDRLLFLSNGSGKFSSFDSLKSDVEFRKFLGEVTK
jgi:ATP-binding cassette subfamily B multidrug efflux pump